MLNKVSEYKLIEDTSADSLTQRINDNISQGWVPSGAPFEANGHLYQAVLKFS